jgi:hypothetical protein
MLLQGQFPELAADLVATLSNLDGDELTGHVFLAGQSSRHGDLIHEKDVHRRERLSHRGI